MTTKPRAKKFRIRRSGSLGMEGARTASQPNEQADVPPAATNKQAEAAQAQRVQQQQPNQSSIQGDVDSPTQVSTENDTDTIRKEGLTGRQLRMARRVAQKHGLAPTSDFDAVRQLRAKGIDPFQRANILELVVPEDTGSALDDGTGNSVLGHATGGTLPIRAETAKVQLPQTVPADGANLPSTELRPADRRAVEIQKIQRDIAKRRRLKVMMLMSRLAFFVFLPTIVAGWYFYVIATPMYATYSEFVIQKAESAGGAPGLGSIFQGTGLATQTEATGVQSYLLSRDALNRLNQEEDFKGHFSAPEIDVIQRLPSDASSEDAFAMYQNRILIGYDPTEGLLKMEVIAADPQVSEAFSRALISYAEEEVDNLTNRLRGDQMRSARVSYEEAEARRYTALEEWLTIQQDAGTLGGAEETGILLQQIGTIESQMQQKQLELQTLTSVRRPNEARVNAVQGEITRLQNFIDQLRAEATAKTENGGSQIEVTTRIRVAEENYQFQSVMVQQALQQMESARLEAERQVSYISLNVNPVAPDAAAYPRAFENTVLAFLIFAGVYLMISLTASILREQVSS